MNSFDTVFATIPMALRDRLEKSYTEIKVNYTQRRWEPSELNGGKLSETVLRILEWHTSPGKTFTPYGTAIPDFGKATRTFESMTAFPDSVRFHIPKLLNSLYTIRNKRGVGHEGGDVDPNHMDATLVVSVANWILAELVRVFHKVTTDEAQRLVESLTIKTLPVVWEVNGKSRILNPKLDFTEKTLLLLYRRHPAALTGRQLFDWTEHSHWTTFRKTVLHRCHKKERWLDYDEDSDLVHLSPTGLAHVEKNIPLEIT